MVNYIEELSVTEAENLKKTIAALFRQTCILQMKYDPVTLIPRDNLHYEICMRHRKFIEDYLSISNCELVHDPQEHIFRLQGDGIIVEKVNITVTKVILLIKLIYRDKILGEGLKATVTNDKGSVVEMNTILLDSLQQQGFVGEVSFSEETRAENDRLAEEKFAEKLENIKNIKPARLLQLLPGERVMVTFDYLLKRGKDVLEEEEITLDEAIAL